MQGEVYLEKERSGNESEEEKAPENNVHRLDLEGKKIILIGTAHVSSDSAQLVERIIEEERPDAVCVELCNTRYASILRHGLDREPNLLDLLGMRKGQFLSWLMLWYFQKKVGQRLGIKPGMEIIRALEAAKAAGATVHPIDRDIRVTLERAWKLTSTKAKILLAAQLALSLGTLNEIKQEDIESLKREDLIEQSIEELGKTLPVLRQVILDERDIYMAERIAALQEQKIVAVVGAAHVQGILRHLSSARFIAIARANSLEAA